MSDTLRPRIEVIGLTKRFKRVGGDMLTPVDDISLSVGPREMVVLVGPSGCGKTTLLRCIAGLEKPDSGEIVLDGKLVYSSKRNIFTPPTQRQLSMIFQSFALWPHMSVFENIAYPLESRKVPRDQIAPRVREAMRMVGISDLERQYPGRISGGQQQRVALARALVSNSLAVLFDEPLSNVDARVREQLRVEMKSMQSQLHFSGLYVTHDQAEAMELGDRIAVLQSGHVAALGRPGDVYDNPPTEYVATVLGSANIWPATIAASSADGLVLDTPIGALRSNASGSTNIASTRVMVRPERVRITRAADAPPDAIAGVIATRSFAGPSQQFFVQCGEHIVRVVATRDESSDHLGIGDAVALTIDPRWVKLLQHAEGDA